jgi:hypothetical protein
VGVGVGVLVVVVVGVEEEGVGLLIQKKRHDILKWWMSLSLHYKMCLSQAGWTSRPSSRV